MINLSYEQREEIGLKFVREQLDPVSPYGEKYLRNEGFYPEAERGLLLAEFTNITLLKEAWEKEKAAVEAIRHAMSMLKDLSGSLKNAAGQTLNEVELFELTSFCLRLRALIPLAASLASYEDLIDIRLTDPENMLKVLDPKGEGSSGFYVEDERTPRLSAARQEKKQAERALREKTGNRELLLAKRQAAAAEEDKALSEIYEQMTRDMRPYLHELAANMAAVGHLDADLAKALLACRFHCQKPEMGGDTLYLKAALHPQIDAALKERGGHFIPIDIELPRGASVLTGANMGGKSVALKTVLLNTALALSGMFVFAEQAVVPFFDRIEIINRDFSDTSKGLSSFGGEMLRLKAVLERLNEDGLALIVMDELARGTNAREGALIARGAIRYLSGKNAVTLLATHYDGAADAAKRHYQVKGLSRDHTAESLPAAQEKDALRQIENAMDYGLIRVAPGTECPQDAVSICRLLGLPEEIIREEP